MKFFWLLSLILIFQTPGISENQIHLRATVGATKSFLDEPFAPIGGISLLASVGPRFAIGPEYFYTSVNGFRIKSFSATGIFSFAPWTSIATPYVTGSIGAVRDHDVRINFTAKQLNASAGGGLRLSLGRGAFVAPEVRLGSYSFPTAVLHLGYSF